MLSGARIKWKTAIFICICFPCALPLCYLSFNWCAGSWESRQRVKTLSNHSDTLNRLLLITSTQIPCAIVIHRTSNRAKGIRSINKWTNVIVSANLVLCYRKKWFTVFMLIDKSTRLSFASDCLSLFCKSDVIKHWNFFRKTIACFHWNGTFVWYNFRWMTHSKSRGKNAIWFTGKCIFVYLISCRKFFPISNSHLARNVVLCSDTMARRPSATAADDDANVSNIEEILLM